MTTSSPNRERSLQTVNAPNPERPNQSDIKAVSTFILHPRLRLSFFPNPPTRHNFSALHSPAFILSPRTSCDPQLPLSLRVDIAKNSATAAYCESSMLSHNCVDQTFVATTQDRNKLLAPPSVKLIGEELVDSVVLYVFLSRKISLLVCCFFLRSLHFCEDNSTFSC